MIKHFKFAAILLLLALGQRAMAYDVEVDGIYYNLNSSAKTATITHKGTKDEGKNNSYSGEVTIPSTFSYNGEIYTVTSVGDRAFYYCEWVTRVKLPETITSIGDVVFQDCHRLTDINLPDGITSIGEWSLSQCYALESVELPQSLTQISYSLFRTCTSLKNVTIGANVTKIGVGSSKGIVFKDCPLENLIIKGASVATLEEYSTSLLDFTSYDYEFNVYVPASLISAYKSSNNWKNYTNIHFLNIDSYNAANADLAAAIVDAEETYAQAFEKGTINLATTSNTSTNATSLELNKILNNNCTAASQTWPAYPTDAPYLQVDLSSSPITNFYLTIAPWANATYGYNDTPSGWTVTASNDDGDDKNWTEIGFWETEVPQINPGQNYTYPLITLGNTYKYIRFTCPVALVNRTGNTKHFALSIFTLNSATPYGNDVANAADALATNIATAKVAVENNTATASDIATLTASTAALQAALNTARNTEDIDNLTAAIAKAQVAKNAAFVKSDSPTGLATISNLTTNEGSLNVAQLVDEDLNQNQQTWNKYTGGNGWLKVNLDTPVSAVFFGMVPANSDYYATDLPKSFTVEVSNDDSNWTTIGSYITPQNGLAKQTWAISEAIPLGGEYSYVRFTSDGPMGGTTRDSKKDFFALAEFQVYALESTSAYLTDNTVQGLVDQLNTLIEQSQAKVAAHTANAADVTALENATAQLYQALYPSLSAEGVEIGGLVYNIANGVAKLTEGNKSCTLTNVVIPSAIEYGGQTFTVGGMINQTFRGNNKIQSLSFEGETFNYDGGTQIFENMSALTSLILAAPAEGSSKALEGWAIAGTALPEIVIPEGFVNLKGSMFRGNSHLTTVTLPSTLTNIGDYNFYNCGNIETIYSNAATAPSWTGSDFHIGNISVIVPSQTAKANYKVANHWKDVKLIITQEEKDVVDAPTDYVADNHGVATLSGTVSKYTIDAYKGNIGTGYTAIDMSSATIDDDLEASDITDMQSGNILIYLPNSAAITSDNIVVGNTCSNLVLTDGQPFSAPSDFTATSATYSRTMTNEWGTICLPYDVSSDENTEYYNITGIENGSSLVVEKVDNLAAGTPALVRKVSGDAITATAANVPVSATINNTSGSVTMYGAFEETKVENPDAYYIKSNKFWQCNNYFFCDPFRAYFVAASAGSNTFDIVVNDDDLTGLNNAAAAATSEAVAIYSIDGKRLGTLQQGVNIVKLSNGKTQKVVVK